MASAKDIGTVNAKATTETQRHGEEEMRGAEGNRSDRSDGTYVPRLGDVFECGRERRVLRYYPDLEKGQTVTWYTFAFRRRRWSDVWDVYGTENQFDPHCAELMGWRLVQRGPLLGRPK